MTGCVTGGGVGLAVGVRTLAFGAGGTASDADLVVIVPVGGVDVALVLGDAVLLRGLGEPLVVLSVEVLALRVIERLVAVGMPNRDIERLERERRGDVDPELVIATNSISLFSLGARFINRVLRRESANPSVKSAF